MKKQILSLLALVTVIGSVASANIGQSDVPDNMLSQQVKGPWDPCTDAELKNKSCTKTIYASSAIMQPAQPDDKSVFAVTVLDGSCGNYMEVTTPSQNRLRIGSKITLDEKGNYTINNQGFEPCKVLLTIEERQ